MIEVKEKYEPRLLKIPGVLGVFADEEDGVIEVYVKSEDVQVPSELDGIPVRKVVIGEIRALRRCCCGRT